MHRSETEGFVHLKDSFEATDSWTSVPLPFPSSLRTESLRRSDTFLDDSYSEMCMCINNFEVDCRDCHFVYIIVTKAFYYLWWKIGKNVPGVIADWDELCVDYLKDNLFSQNDLAFNKINFTLFYRLFQALYTLYILFVKYSQLFFRKSIFDVG